jgi:uncharacterized protein (TIGR03067 family)
VASECQGKPATTEEAKEMLPSELMFTGTQYGIWAGKKQRALRVDAGRKPAETDFTTSVFDGVQRMAICELDGDRLKLCMAFVGPNHDPPRPTGFTTDAQSGASRRRRLKSAGRQRATPEKRGRVGWFML